jgi:hypothetical protein
MNEVELDWVINEDGSFTLFIDTEDESSVDEITLDRETANALAKAIINNHNV